MDSRGREVAVAWNGALSEWKGSSLSDLWVEMWERCLMMVCLAGSELTREKGAKPITTSSSNSVPPQSSHTHLLTSTMGKRKRNNAYMYPTVAYVQPPPPFSPPIAMQRSVWDSIMNGNFVDAKIFAFSRRSREPGRVDTPKTLFVNTHVLATACSYFRSGMPSLVFFGRLPFTVPSVRFPRWHCD